MRDDARRLLDELPEEDLPFLLRFLRGLKETGSHVPRSLAQAPVDDEPWTPDDETAYQAGMHDIERGALHSLDDVRRMMGA